MSSRLALLYCSMLAAASCALPDYTKVGLDKSDAVRTDAGVVSALGVLGGASSACGACIEASCQAPLDACGDACSELSLPITPATPAPESVDGFLGCLQEHCESQCELNWGCVGQYRWPSTEQDYSVAVQAVDIISENPLREVSIAACENSDPSCSEGSGLVGNGTTDRDGYATLGVPHDFLGYFSLQGSDDYLPAIALWTQPTYIVTQELEQRMISVEVAQALAKNTESTLLLDQSHVIFRALNCLPLRYADAELPHADADDVVVSFSPVGKDTSRVFYTGTGEAIDVSLSATSRVGSSYGGAFNLPVRTLSVIAKHAGVEVSQAAIQLRKGSVGFVYLVPNTR